MNPRLTEIYRSCRSKEGLASQDEYKSANVLLGTEVEKFAELIVRECVQSIEKTIETNCDTDSEKMGCEFAITDMLEHFGVEE